jgi:hypothetical protein
MNEERRRNYVYKQEIVVKANIRIALDVTVRGLDAAIITYL